MDEAPVSVGVLGPLRLVVGADAVEVRGPMRRGVLALLALAEGREVSVDDLIGALWPIDVADSGRSALHTHVSRLRGHLGPASTRLETRQQGYRLRLGPNELDLARARVLLASARRTAAQDPATAVVMLQEAHALWRGPILADLTDILPVAAGVRGCVQLHREVADALIGCAVDAGQAGRVVALAGEALATDPLREPALLLMMRVLAATGSAVEALRIGREYRLRVADEAGLDPSPALADLERDIASGTAGPPPTTRLDASVASPTRLFGRDTEVAALHRQLAAERLVTVVGPGGVGKTRVAFEVARQSTPPAPMLRLASVTAPEAIPHALADAIGLSVVNGDVLTACRAFLGNQPCLLVIDNCEHLLDAVRDVVDALLATCPELTILTTSREPLSLAVEHTVRLAPLAVPGPHLAEAAEIARVPSVELFLGRAARVRSTTRTSPTELELVVDIVRRLDGMPLALELAAGRLSTFSLTDLQARLDRSLDLLAGYPGRDPRHRTLRATLDWSYRLLSEGEQRLFRHLSVFVDGTDLATVERLAAELVPGSDPGAGLSRLVDASMIDATFGDTTRYRMLETLRRFGLDQLAAQGELSAAEQRLLSWAEDLTGWIDTTISTDVEPDADAALRCEIANLRAAWRLARERGEIDAAAAIVQSLCDAAVFNRDLVEVRGWAIELAADPAITGHPRASAVLGTAAFALYHSGNYQRAEQLARTGLHLSDGRSAYCRHSLAVVLLARGAYGEVVQHCLAGAEHGDSRHSFLGIAALASTYSGDLDSARNLNDRWLAAAESPSTRAWGAYYAGEIENVAGRHEAAELHYVRAMELGRSVGSTFVIGVATVGLQSVRAAAGRVDEALIGYRDAIDYFSRTGNWTHQWTTLRNLATLLHWLGDDEPATALEAAAASAPDAPAPGIRTDDEPPPQGPEGSIGVSRAALLETARQSIQRNLTRS